MKQAGKTNIDVADALAYPLSAFYDNGAAPRLEPVAERDLPSPYRQLLVHDSDMTSVLERHHGQPMSLCVLSKRQQAQTLLRQVVLVCEHSQHAAEFGAVMIDLDQFEPPARQTILAGRLPLGAILRRCQIDYTSCVTGCFRIKPDPLMRQVFGPVAEDWLFGRHNRLVAGPGRIVAEVVEVLPPEQRARRPGS